MLFVYIPHLSAAGMTTALSLLSLLWGLYLLHGLILFITNKEIMNLSALLRGRFLTPLISFTEVITQ